MKASGRLGAATGLLRALFAAEKRAKEASVEERLALRQQHSGALLAEFREKLPGGKQQLLPKHRWPLR